MPLPFPHSLDECLAPQVLTFLALAGQLALDHHLRGDAGVVGARQPQGDETAHAMPAHNDVHLRLVEHVAHVQPSSHIGRRQEHGEHRPRLSRRRRRNRKKLFFDPVLRPARFNGARLVRFGEIVGHGNGTNQSAFGT